MSQHDHGTTIDFQFGIGQIIPSTQQAYRGNVFDGQVKKEEKAGLHTFKKEVSNFLDEKLHDTEQFPSDHEIFVFILQYFVSVKEYKRRDVDNLSKTVLDVLKGRFYVDDSQVKTLLVGKKMEKEIPQNFAYIAIKEIKDGGDVDALKISGIARSVTLFQELKSKGYL